MLNLKLQPIEETDFDKFEGLYGYEDAMVRARDLFGSQIPVTTGRFELRISCIRSSYVNH